MEDFVMECFSKARALLENLVIRYPDVPDSLHQKRAFTRSWDPFIDKQIGGTKPRAVSGKPWTYSVGW